MPKTSVLVTERIERRSAARLKLLFGLNQIRRLSAEQTVLLIASDIVRLSIVQGMAGNKAESAYIGFERDEEDEEEEDEEDEIDWDDDDDYDPKMEKILNPQSAPP